MTKYVVKRVKDSGCVANENTTLEYAHQVLYRTKNLISKTSPAISVMVARWIFQHIIEFVLPPKIVDPNWQQS